MDPSLESPNASQKAIESSRVDPRRSTRARRMLRIGSVAVMVPLAVLLWLQYQWLQDLERTSTIARQESLENYLGVIAKEIKLKYWTAAQGMLNLPEGSIAPEYFHKVDDFFHKRMDPITRRFFVVNFLLPNYQSVQFYQPETQSLIIPEWTPEWIPELSAVNMAIAPWRVLRKKGGPVDDEALIVEERDRGHRMILKPLTDEDSTLIGLVGMILDEEHFRSVILPEAIAGALPEFKNKEKLKVSVKDREGRWVLGEDAWNESGADLENPPINRSFLLVFRDWRVFLIGPSSAPEDWAKANFAFNLSLTLVLSASVIAGMGLLLRATSREMHLSEMKNDFVSNVSHELRTPLASIRVFGELLRLGKIQDFEKVRQYGNYIEAESRRLTQLINNILDFSCIESGRKAYSFETVDLAEVTQQMLDTWRIRLEHQGFTLEVNEAPNLPSVRADPDAIGQALFNLLDNAVKYSGDSKQIEVQLRHYRQEAVIEVIDHGIGISRPEQKHIFDRFHRVGSGLAHDVKGSGLGLSLVQHIAAAHGGRVKVHSNLGQGSTFTLYLPITPKTTEDELGMSTFRTETV